MCVCVCVRASVIRYESQQSQQSRDILYSSATAAAAAAATAEGREDGAPPQQSGIEIYGGVTIGSGTIVDSLCQLRIIVRKLFP